MSEPNGNGHSDGIGITGMMVLVKCDDEQVRKIDLDSHQQERLFAFITTELYGGEIRFSAPAPSEPEPSKLIVLP